MAQFSRFPALSVQGPTDIALQGQRLKNMRGASRLREFQLGQAQGTAQRQGQLRGVMGAVGAEAGLGPNAQQALSLDPSQLTALMKIPKAERDRAKEKATMLGNLALGVLTAPPVQRAAMWGQAREAAIAAGAKPQNVPELYGADVEEKLRLWVAKAGKIKTLLDQVPDTPGGYRRTEGGLEFTPGGPADPKVAGRLAEAKRDPNGGVTPAQQANNAEIDQARETLATLALDKTAIKRLTQRFADTGRVNTEFEQLLDRVLRTATQRKVGDDPDFKRVYRQYYGATPPPIPTPPDVLTEFGLDDLSSLGGDDTPAPAPGGAPRRGTPRAGGRFGPRGRGGAKAIPKMSLTEIDDLVSTKGDSLSPAEMKAVQARLAALGK
ncbi:MAG: hypothetical protein IID48_17075 [Proteobacteria bacterium]|nr:hypothetical protein [Pseudomonadota bacterium]